MSAAHARKEPRTKAKRVVFRVSWASKARMWAVRGNGGTTFHRTKRGATADAVLSATRMYTGGIRTQVVIHKRDGRIESERTYGGDPVRRKG